MDGERIRLRAVRLLRSALLAGAGAAVWLTLSAGSANADAGPDILPSTPNKPVASLLGSSPVQIADLVPAAVDAVQGAVRQAAPARPATVPAPVTGETGLAPGTAPSPVVQPPVASVTEAADRLVARVPLVGSIVPEGSVSTVTTPVTGSLGNAVQETVQPVVEAVAPAVPVVEPVTDTAQPILDLVAPAASVVPELITTAESIHSIAGLATVALANRPEALPFAGAAGDIPLAQTGATTSGTGLAQTAAPARAAPGAAVNREGERSPDSPAPPRPFAGPNGLGSGSVHASYDFSGASAGWLQGVSVMPPPVLVPGGLSDNNRLPSSVPFDPGSSPD